LSNDFDEIQGDPGISVNLVEIIITDVVSQYKGAAKLFV